MKKAKLCLLLMVPVVLLFAGCALEGEPAILTIKNQSSLEITGIAIWRGAKALEEAKLKLTEAELNIVFYPSLANTVELIAAGENFNAEVTRACRRSPEITDAAGLPVNALKSWELPSGSIIVRADCGGKTSSPYVVNFGGNHVVRFTGKNVSNPDGKEDDWE